MNKLSKAIAIVAIVIGGAYFFLIDHLLESQLEKYGSQALQAPLAVGAVSFHLLPTALTLRNVEIGNPKLSTHNLVEADEVVLPFSLSDLFAHKFIVDSIDVHGLRFHRARNEQATTANTPGTNASPQLREALQRAQQMLNHPLTSNTLDPNVSLSGALLADQFKPLLTQISTALIALTTSPSNLGDWQILIRRANLDGTLDFGSSGIRFVGSLDNITPQPALFDTVTQLDVNNAESETATLRIKGTLDKRKLTQATLRFDLNDFSLTQWPLSSDPELKVVIVNANANVQAMLSLTGNQFDFNALTAFQQTHFEIASGNNDIARTIAAVLQRTTAFDIHLQASGESNSPRVKINSSLDVPLANALQQLQPSSFPPVNGALSP